MVETMTILDDHNPYPGLRSVRPLQGDQSREGKIWALVGFVASVMWIAGLASLVAIFAGVLARMQLRESAQTSLFARLAIFDVIVGFAGLVLAFVVIFIG